MVGSLQHSPLTRIGPRGHVQVIGQHRDRLRLQGVAASAQRQRRPAKTSTLQRLERRPGRSGAVNKLQAH
eukprot:5563178-Lingulodinium_polyedra.AAC.1